MFPYINIANLAVAQKECVIICTERETVYTVCPYAFPHQKLHAIYVVVNTGQAVYV